jgi:hypothetical protein
MTDAGLTGVEQEVTSVLDVTSRYVVQIRVSDGLHWQAIGGRVDCRM